MEALYTPTWEKDGVMMEEEDGGEREQREEGEMEASSPMGSTDEETDEDSEPETRPAICRKVSFADAFGLNLVSVKEFDIADLTEPEVSEPPQREVIHPSEEFYMSCLFTPFTPEELDQRLQEQRVELESIELLPGSTTLRGIIRVVNLCYSKSVYVRITLDSWSSHFDLLAEYVPGSSDRKTDGFAFKYSLVPPFAREGTKVEFCLRYETSVGTFWANNKDVNYVLFCHQNAHVKEVKAKEQGPQVQEESPGPEGTRSKRSCLKANRRGSAEEKTSETLNIATASAEAAATHKAEEAERETLDRAEIHSILYHEEHKPLVDSMKSQHRATQDDLSQRQQEVPKACSDDSANGPADTRFQPTPTSCGSSAGFLRIRQKKRNSKGPQVLTYHQIPLLTLDWSNDKPPRWGTADVDDIWTGGIKRISSKTSKENKDNTPSVSDLWEAFLKGTGENIDDSTSVCDIWQAFLNGPDCKNHSGVPESEWLQTAASVSPSNHKGTDTPTHEHTHNPAGWQSVSHTGLNADAQQPAEVCIGTPRDDNGAARDTSLKSEASSETDTLQEFGLMGATPVSEGSADSLAQWHKRTVGERERERNIAREGGEELSNPHIDDLVTSSRETGTTEMTAMPPSANASAVDRISQGARTAEGLSSGGEGEVTSTAHNATDDTMAFRETIRQGRKDGGRFVLFTSRQGAEDGFTPNCTEKKVYAEKEIFRPQETEISRRYADEREREEFRPKQSSENALKQNETDEDEMRPGQSHAEEFNLNQTHEEEFRQSHTTAREFKLDESEPNDSGLRDSRRTAREEAKTQSNVEVESEQTQESTSQSHGDVNTSGQTKEEYRPDLQGDGCKSNPMEAVELRWNQTLGDVKSQKEEAVGGEMVVRLAEKELPHLPAVLERIEESMSQRGREEKVSIGKLKMEATEELMDDARDARESPPAKLKEREEYIAADDSVPLELRESGREREEVLDWKDDAGSLERERDMVEGEGGGPADGAIQDNRRSKAEALSEDDLNDSGVFSFTETLPDPNITENLYQVLNQTSATGSDKPRALQSSRAFINTTQTPPSGEGATESDAPLRRHQDLQASPVKDDGNQIKERSVSHQETCSESEAAAHTESFTQSANQSSSSEELDEPAVLVRWSVLYFLRPVSRTLAYALLVAGFFVITLLYDFPACFALYVFSLCWWFCQWKRHQATEAKRMAA